MLRRTSWLLFAMSVTAPPLFGYCAIQADLAAQKALAPDSGLCGNASVGIYLVALIAAGLPSLVAGAANGIDLKRSTGRGLARYGELLLISAPAMISVAAIASITIG